MNFFWYLFTFSLWNYSRKYWCRTWKKNCVKCLSVRWNRTGGNHPGEAIFRVITSVEPCPALQHCFGPVLLSGSLSVHSPKCMLSWPPSFDSPSLWHSWARLSAVRTGMACNKVGKTGFGELAKCFCCGNSLGLRFTQLESTAYFPSYPLLGFPQSLPRAQSLVLLPLEF